jgi:hypothetical protein
MMLIGGGVALQVILIWEPQLLKINGLEKLTLSFCLGMEVVAGLEVVEKLLLLHHHVLVVTMKLNIQLLVVI